MFLPKCLIRNKTVLSECYSSLIQTFFFLFKFVADWGHSLQGDRIPQLDALVSQFEIEPEYNHSYLIASGLHNGLHYVKSHDVFLYRLSLES